MSFASCGRNKKLVYWLKKLTPTTWAEPIAIRVNAMPLVAEEQIQVYGTLSQTMYKALGTVAEIGEWKQGDLLYIDKPLPATFRPAQNNAEDANFDVGIPKVLLNRVEIPLTKKSGR